ncbi:unnamed protein product, partial [Iphiclides podalirius]
MGWRFGADHGDAAAMRRRHGIGTETRQSGTRVALMPMSQGPHCAGTCAACVQPAPAAVALSPDHTNRSGGHSSYRLDVRA